mgnify:FL=1
MERLPKGRHGLSQEYVARNQRERLIAALVQVIDEVGWRNTTVAMVSKRAGVSKSDFYRHFESKDDCFLAAYDRAVEHVHAGVAGACLAHDGAAWSPRIRDGIAALIATLQADPPLARLALVEGLRVGRGAYDRYQAALAGFVPYLRDGAPSPPLGDGLPPTTHEAVVGGIASLIGRQVRTRGVERLGELLPDVVEFALTPYVGAREARRITSGA